MTEDRAKRLASLMDHPGWHDLLALRDDAISSNRGYLDNALESHPEKLTTKTAIAKANRIKALRDFFDDVECARKILAQTREGGQ